MKLSFWYLGGNFVNLKDCVSGLNLNVEFSFFLIDMYNERLKL